MEQLARLRPQAVVQPLVVLLADRDEWPPFARSASKDPVREAGPETIRGLANLDRLGDGLEHVVSLLSEERMGGVML